MSYNIIPTPGFEKELKQLAKKYPSVKKDILLLAARLMVEPKTGTPLGNNCYKIRIAIASKGKGKSGGGRVITFVQVIESNVFLLSIYDKSDVSSITDADLKERLKDLK